MKVFAFSKAHFKTSVGPKLQRHDSIIPYINSRDNARIIYIGRQDTPDVASNELNNLKPRVPNGLGKTGLDQLVWSKVRSSPMVEIRPTGWSGL